MKASEERGSAEQNLLFETSQIVQLGTGEGRQESDSQGGRRQGYIREMEENPVKVSKQLESEQDQVRKT